jgi:hypothetical protein
MNNDPKSKKPLQLAPGYAWCSSCERTRARKEFGNDRRRKGGLSFYCKECANRKGRNFYATRHREGGDSEYIPSGAAHVPVELFPPSAEGESIGCLRCRHARLLSANTFNAATPRIHCARQNANVPVVFTACPIADPRPMKPRDLRLYWNKHGPLGDKLSKAGEVMKAYLKARWAVEESEALERATGWTMFKIAQVVRYHRLGGAKTKNNRLHWMDPRKGRVCFTSEQTAFLMEEYCSPRWPRPIIYSMKGARKAARRRAQNKLVARCNELGPPWSWEQILRHVEKQMRKRGDRARSKTKGRRVNQFLIIPETNIRSTPAKPDEK